MKKIIYLFLALLTTLPLTGGIPPVSILGYACCGDAAGMLHNVNNTENHSANAGGRIITADKTETAEGHIGDTMRTCFFDFTVNRFDTCSQYEDYVPAEGSMLTAVDITVKNTTEENISMYDNDFQIQWDDPAEDAWRAPVTCFWYENPPVFVGENVLPAEYSLAPNESRTGLLIFEIPQESGGFNLSYLETFSYEDEEELFEGDLFFVYFHEAQSCAENHLGYIIGGPVQTGIPGMETSAGNQNVPDAWTAYGREESPLYNANGRLISADRSGSAEGHIGDTMLTYFFDFSVNSFELCGQYKDYAAADGYMLAAVEISIKNTFHESIPMFDTDFAINWGEGANFEYPLTWYMGPFASTDENMLPYEYTLAAGEIRTGLLIFEIPFDSDNLNINYLEEFDDNTIGDIFSVYIHDKDACPENHSGNIIRDTQHSTDFPDKI